MAMKKSAGPVKTNSKPTGAAAGLNMGAGTASSAGSSAGQAAGATPVRNTAIPKAGKAGRKEVSHEQIAIRAYEISQSGSGGTQEQNWLRAERELRGA